MKRSFAYSGGSGMVGPQYGRRLPIVPLKKHKCNVDLDIYIVRKCIVLKHLHGELAR